MAVTPTYPGVYISETAAVPHTVIPATTNLTAFIGQFPQGPTGEAVFVSSTAEFESIFGGLNLHSSYAAYGVEQFFLNGGVGAWIVRVVGKGKPAQTKVAAKGPGQGYELTVDAISPGSWSTGLEVALASPIDPATGQPAEHASHGLFTVSPATPKPPAAHKAPAAATKQTPAQAQTPPAQAQTPPAQAQTPAPAPKPKPKLNVPPSPPVPPLETITIPWNGPDGKPLTEQALQALINNQSSFVNVTNVGPPPDKASSAPGTFPATKDPLLEGIDLANAIVAQFEPTAPLSLLAPNEFNLLCLPDISIMEFDIQAEAIAAALLFCEENDAFFIVDPPPPDGVSADLTTPVGKVGVPAGDGIKHLTSWAQPLLTPKHVFGATYYPWVQIVDTVTGQPRWMPPSGAIAGVYAATDAARGWWKAPAGIDAGLEGVTGLADPTLNDTVNGQLYSMGINCLRTFPLFGSIVWGARTLAGSTLGQSPFKYVNVRRAANFIELSLQQSLRWAVFEDNDEGLWASIRVEVETFMAGLLAVGAVEAFTVACDATTTSVVDQLNGVVNVNVGFVPARPVEFVMLNVQIQAGPPAAS